MANGKQKKRMPSAPKRKPKTRMARRPQNAPVAMGTKKQPRNSSKSNQTGTEEITHVATVEGIPRGQLVVNFELNGQSTPRLRRFGQNFQRIRYRNVRFSVQAEGPTSVPGSYVAAFIRDADDSFDMENMITTISSTQGFVKGKWWETKDVNVSSIDQTWFYTSPGADPRWFSPGRFVVAVNSASNQLTPITITMHYTVEFKDPSYEVTPAATLSTTLAMNCFFTGNTYLSKSPLAYEPVTLADVGLTSAQMEGKVVDTGRWTMGLIYDATESKIGYVRYLGWDGSGFYGATISLAGEPVLLTDVHANWDEFPVALEGDTWYVVSPGEGLHGPVVDFTERARKQERQLSRATAISSSTSQKNASVPSLSSMGKLLKKMAEELGQF